MMQRWVERLALALPRPHEREDPGAPRLLSLSLRVQRREGADRQIPKPGDRPPDASCQRYVAPAEVSLLLEPTAPALGFLAREVEAKKTAPPADQIPASGHAHVEQVTRPIPMRVLVQGKPGETGRLELHTAERTGRTGDEGGIPRSGSELDVLVREPESAQLERV